MSASDPLQTLASLLLTNYDRRRLPRRIAIIGNAGTGKSTLAQRLAELLAIEVHYLDELLWRPHWQIAPEDEFRRAHAELISRASWIIEGVGYPSTIRERVEKADTIVLTLYPLWRCYWWSLKRELKSEAAVGRPLCCPLWPVFGRLIQNIWRVHWRVLPEVQRDIQEAAGDAQVFVLRRPADARAFLDRFRDG